MKKESKDAYLGIFVAAGIYYTINLAAFSIISMLNLANLTDIRNNLFNKSLFELLPFLIISLLLISKIKLSKTFEIYYKIMIGVIIVGEIILSLTFF